MKKLFIFIVILVVVLVILKDGLLTLSIEGAISFATGLKVHIGELKSSIPKTFISIKDITVYNPPGFTDRTMIDIPEVYVDYSFIDLLARKIHLQNVRINLKQFTIVTAQDGSRNLDFIKNLKAKTESKGKGRSKEIDRKQAEWQIDKLFLKMGRAVYKDYTSGGRAKVSEYNLNIDARYENVKNLNELIKIIVAKAIMNTALESIYDLGSFDRIKGITSGTLEEGKKIIEKTVEDIKGIFGDSF